MLLMLDTHSKQRKVLMKKLYALVAALCVTGGANQAAAQFNPDALKKMQKEGHDIVAESQGEHTYRFGKDLCLDASDTLAVRKCDSKARSQHWKTDDQDRLVAHNGQCLVGGKLGKCGAGNAQIWSHDKQGRLANRAGKCLQVQGRPPRAGAKVIAVECNASPAQVWTRPGNATKSAGDNAVKSAEADGR